MEEIYLTTLVVKTYLKPLTKEIEMHTLTNLEIGAIVLCVLAVSELIRKVYHTFETRRAEKALKSALKPFEKDADKIMELIWRIVDNKHPEVPMEKEEKSFEDKLISLGEEAIQAYDEAEPETGRSFFVDSPYNYEEPEASSTFQGQAEEPFVKEIKNFFNVDEGEKTLFTALAVTGDPLEMSKYWMKENLEVVKVIGTDGSRIDVVTGRGREAISEKCFKERYRNIPIPAMHNESAGYLKSVRSCGFKV